MAAAQGGEGWGSRLPASPHPLQLPLEAQVWLRAWRREWRAPGSHFSAECQPGAHQWRPAVSRSSLPPREGQPPPAVQRGSACASRAASNAGKRHRRVSCGRASGRSRGPDPASAVTGQRGASEASDRARAQTHSVGDGAGVTLNSNVIGPHALHSGGDRPLPHVLPWAEGVCTAWGPWEKAAEKME